MSKLPPPLAALGAYPQFILWKATPSAKTPGKVDKLPVDHRSGEVASAQDAAIWTDAETAIETAEKWGDGYGYGFVFSQSDPFFFLDIDDCLEGADWSTLAKSLLAVLPGAAVELSQSGRGLHIIGTGTPPEHSCKNVGLGLELYHEARFVALTGRNAVGDASTDCSQRLPGLVSSYFAPKAASVSDWTTEPHPDWKGPEDDEKLLERALASQSASSVFGSSASFKDLWEGSTDAHAGDASSADAALAQHLAFWTGSNCERMKRLMLRSELKRDKWEREDYLPRTILYAVSLQKTFYVEQEQLETDDPRAVKIRASSEKQAAYADSIRARKIVEAGDNDDWVKAFCNAAKARFWIDNADTPASEIAAMLKPIAEPTDPFRKTPEMVSGYQYLAATQQLALFDKCVYIQEIHKALTPSGALLKESQFNATYGGYVFQMDELGEKTTRSAWDAFTQSQIVRFPKSETLCFRPQVEPGEIIEEGGRTMANAYVPVETQRVQGDATPFLDHLGRTLPSVSDQAILLAYMAACVQHKGVKFQWAPLLQGAEGNGKTLFSRCVAYAIGDRYVHWPNANQMAEKYNAWLFNRLFIGVEDVYVPEHKREIIEVLKPMITNDRLACRDMGQIEVTRDVCANFILNSNHRDAIRKTRTDRRFAVFYTAQQEPEDIKRYGMTGDYFPKLYAWLKNGGYAIVADMLDRYEIPDALNPATQCHRAPETSSTFEAISESVGSIEQEIVEAIEEGRRGFKDGWISSIHLDKLLSELRATLAIPRNRRRTVLRELGYDWHPALPQGRVNSVLMCDGGKPRLFIHKDSMYRANLTKASEVAKQYEASQEAEQPQPQKVAISC